MPSPFSSVLFSALAFSAGVQAGLGPRRSTLTPPAPRSRQIKEQLEKTGYSGPEAAQIAAHSTRDRKQPLTAEEVLSAHRDMAASVGSRTSDRL